MSYDFSLANHERIINDSYQWYYESEMQIPTTYQRVADTTPPVGFDSSLPYYRGQVGVMDVQMKTRKEGESIQASGSFEDYPWQMKRREKAAVAVITDDLIEAGERATINFIQKFVQAAAMKYQEVLDDHAASMFNTGMLTTPTTASQEVFGQTVTTRNGEFADPSSTLGLIYDSLPWFDTAHPQSRIVTGTTYSNHQATTYAFTRGNLQTHVNVMRDTNAYNANGERIIITPNQIIYPPALKFTVEPVIAASVVDADLQPNIIGRGFGGWELVEWPRLTNAAGWFVMEARNDLVVIPNWKPTKIDMWYDYDHKVWKVSVQNWFGAGVRGWRRSSCLNVDAA